MLTIILGVAVFVIVIVSLVVALMIAKSKLVASGDVTVTVNDDPEKAIVTQAGDTLLNTLSAQKIFIPSACGGKGTCGVCKVEVHEGGGALLPTETSHVTRGESRHGVVPDVSQGACRVSGRKIFRNEITDMKRLVDVAHDVHHPAQGKGTLFGFAFEIGNYDCIQR